MCRHGTYLNITRYSFLYQAVTAIRNKQFPNTNDVSGQQLAAPSTGPGEAAVAWPKVQATMEMHDDGEGSEAQQM